MGKWEISPGSVINIPPLNITKKHIDYHHFYQPTSDVLNHWILNACDVYKQGCLDRARILNVS